MTPRLLTLAVSAALLTLAGCATQQGVAESADATNQRLSGLETRLQADAKSQQERIAELGKQMDAMARDLQRVQGSVTAQASRQSDLSAQVTGAVAARQAADQALAERLDAAERRLRKLADDNAQAVQQAALREQTRETGQRLDQQVAQLHAQFLEKSQEQDADSAEFSDRIDTLEDQQTGLTDQIAATRRQTETLQATLPGLTEKTDSAGSRIDKSEQRLGEVAARIRETQAQAAAMQASLASVREQADRAGPRLDADAARLAALEKRLDEVMRMAQDALDATGLGQRKIFGKVVESVTLTQDKTLFPINSPDLGDQDKAKLDALALRLKSLGTAYHLQIQGHTDGFGSDDHNYELGMARAVVVKNYLNEQCGIPLLRMSVMSYGALEAASRVGQSNRRIVLQVLQ